MSLQEARGTDLAARVVVHPATGEAIPLDVAAGGSTDILARHRHDLVELKRQLDDLAHALDGELTARLDKANTRSADIGDWRIEGKAPTVTDYPAGALGEALDILISEGRLDADVRGRVLVAQPPPEPKVDKREVNKLLRHTDRDVVDLIREVQREQPQRRTVTVKRRAGR
jgi:hypothetical protein